MGGENKDISAFFDRYYPVVLPDNCIFDCTEHDGKIVSAVAYTIVSKFHIHIVAIVTHPDYRNRGFAKDLLDNLSSLRLTANILFSESQNVAFWKHLNFQICEVNLAAQCMVFEKLNDNNSNSIVQYNWIHTWFILVLVILMLIYRSF